ncbi:MAG: C39 family peptidase [Alistipes sp.]|nr:C39 family peptidase [Alistipes sp.]
MEKQNRRQSARMSSAERERRKRLAAKRRRKKRNRVIRNWCILILCAAVVIIFIKNMKKPEEQKKTGNAENGGNVTVVDAKREETTAVKPEMTEPVTTTPEPTTAEPEPVIKYAFEKPKARQGEELKEYLAELSAKYPEFEEIYDNMDQYPEQLLAALANNPDMIDFVKGYLTEEAAVKGGITKEDMEKEFPLFLQWDRRWGYAHYGDDNIAQSGCGPTCLSMVAVALTRNVLSTPDAVAAYAEQNGYYYPNQGTAWSLMTEGCGEFGVRGEVLPLDKNVIFNALENGNPVICSVRPGDFTAVGHFIVLVGVKEDKLVVNDPNSTIRSSMLWDYEQIKDQISNLWVFYLIGN